MKLSFILGAALVGVALSGWAQEVKEAKPLKPHPSNEFKVREGATAKPSGAAIPSARTSSPATKDLRHIEAQHPKRAAKTRTMPVSGLQEKRTSTPKINFNGNIGGKSAPNRKGQSPYQGRLKQKHQHH